MGTPVPPSFLPALRLPGQTPGRVGGRKQHSCFWPSLLEALGRGWGRSLLPASGGTGLHALVGSPILTSLSLGLHGPSTCAPLPPPAPADPGHSLGAQQPRTRPGQGP